MKLSVVPLLELSDTQLEAVYGGGGAPLGIAPLGVSTGVGAGLSASQACNTRVHSFSFTCDVNIFSNNILKSGVLGGLIDIANQRTQICANND